MGHKVVELNVLYLDPFRDLRLRENIVLSLLKLILWGTRPPLLSGTARYF